MKSEEMSNPDNPHPKQLAPTILDGFMQPGFPAKVFTLFFLDDCLVFVKTGSFSTNMGGTMQTALGGYTGDGLIMGALGSLVDMRNRESRMNNAAAVVSWDPDRMIASHKRNFKIPYNLIRRVELKGPNFAGEVKVLVEADKTHKFRLNKQSKSSIVYYEKTFNKYLPGKIFKQ